MLNLSDVFEVRCIRNSQTLHAISVSPLLKMLFECSWTPIWSPTTNLTLKLFTQTVQLIQPVWNRFSVPAHRQRLRVVLKFILVVRFISTDSCRCFLQHFRGGLLSAFLFDLGVARRLLFSDLVLSLLHSVCHQLQQPSDPCLTLGHQHQLQPLPRCKLTFDFWDFLLILCYGLVNSFDMSFAFFVEMENILIQEWFIAKCAKQSWLSVSCLLISHDPRYEKFPSIQRLLLPFLIEHLVGLILNHSKVNQWISPLEEVFQVLAEGLDIQLVFVWLLDIQRHHLKFV